MAHYKYPNFLSQEYGSEYDALHSVSQAVPTSGVYRCTGCGKSITSIVGRKFPPQSHHTHGNGSAILWQLTVKSHWQGGE